MSEASPSVVGWGTRLWYTCVNSSSRFFHTICGHLAIKFCNMPETYKWLDWHSSHGEGMAILSSVGNSINFRETIWKLYRLWIRLEINICAMYRPPVKILSLGVKTCLTIVLCLYVQCNVQIVVYSCVTEWRGRWFHMFDGTNDVCMCQHNCNRYCDAYLYWDLETVWWLDYLLLFRVCVLVIWLSGKGKET